MCFYVTAAIGEEHEQALRDLLPDGVGLGACENPWLCSLLGAERGVFEVFDISMGCSCPFFTCESEEPEYDDGGIPSHIVRRAKRKKWSEAKLQRAIGSADVRQARRRAGDFVGLRPDLRDTFASFVDTVGDIRLVVHCYSGATATERFRPSGTRTMTAADLRSGSPPIKLDELVTVRTKS